MKSISLLAAIAAATTIAAAPAIAGAPGDWPSYGAHGNWAGLYAGGNLGFAFASGEYEVSVTSGRNSVSAEGEEDDTEFAAGLQVGHNWQSGGTVFGVEGDVTFFDGGDLFSLRGRYGWIMSSGYLLYGTAGLAFASSDEDYPGVDDSTTGFVIGAGAEFDVSRQVGQPNVTAGVEGLYYIFDEEEGDIDLKVNGFNVGRAHYEYDASAFVLRGRVNYHFNK